MLECLILGDSIAVGVHQHRSECVAKAAVGINSQMWNRTYTDRYSAQTVVISLGSNDHLGVKTRAELQRTREKVVSGSRVFWILPAIKPEIQTIVKQIAEEYGDTVLPIAKITKDGVHPTTVGYQQLAEKTK